MSPTTLSAGGKLCNSFEEAVKDVLSREYIEGNWNWKKHWILTDKDSIAIVKKHDGEFERHDVIDQKVFTNAEIFFLQK